MRALDWAMWATRTEVIKSLNNLKVDGKSEGKRRKSEEWRRRKRKRKKRVSYVTQEESEKHTQKR